MDFEEDDHTSPKVKVKKGRVKHRKSKGIAFGMEPRPVRLAEDKCSHSLIAKGAKRPPPGELLVMCIECEYYQHDYFVGITDGK